MASLRELREEAEALAAEVGVSVTTSGLSRAKLEELRDELRNRLETVAAEPEVEPEAPTEPPAPEASDTHGDEGASEPDEPNNPPQESPKPKGYVVAKGVSFCCGRRGILRPGTPITPDYFGDEDDFDAHILAGKIVKG